MVASCSNPIASRASVARAASFSVKNPNRGSRLTFATNAGRRALESMP